VADIIPNSSILDVESFRMANITRRAKAGSDWNHIDLAAYNIRVEFQDVTTFFDTPHLPDPVLTAEEVLEVNRADQTTTDDGYVLLRMLEAAMEPTQNQESAVHDFAAELLRACGYTGRGRLVRTRKEILFLTCGEYKYAEADACILNDKDEVILLVHENKLHLDHAILTDPEAQFIAGAIAAFAENRYKRERSHSSLCQFKTMPGIILHGTSPTFYKIPLSDDLVTAVERGQYPKQETVILTHRPDVLPRARAHRQCYEGMKPLNNRRVILSCFEAFKQIVN
jgi:hypothetical protein